jgi:hypothetical protein
MTPGTVSRRVLAALALVSLWALLSAVAASATHVRPAAASPLRVSLVPAQQPCTRPNGEHEPPLDHLRSCLPPLQTSSAATVGTFDANGFPSQSVAFARIKVINASTAAEDDQVEVEITDVRELATPANDYNPDPTGPDMTLLARIPGSPATTATGNMLRLSDHRNIGPGPVGGAGTTVTFDFPIPVDCNSTPPGIGSTCAVKTTFNTILPGFVKFDPANTSRNRQTIEVGQVQVYDSGADKIRGTNDDTLFAVQGIWNP